MRKVQSAGSLQSKRIISRVASDCLKLVFVLKYLNLLSFFFLQIPPMEEVVALYEGWNFNSGNYLFTTDTK